MSYLKDFVNLISSRNYPAFLRLWEEYCMSDEVDPAEVRELLVRIKGCEFAEPFGKYVENILPLWEKLPDSREKHAIFKLIIDLETTNDEKLRAAVLQYLQQKYPNDAHWNDKIRLTGLRGKENFQGAAAAFELLTHLSKGKFVFHTGGWGVGEIADVSLIREELGVEFEHITGKKHLSFSNAFKVLVPIPDDHFLALRFGNPDALEARAKENPAEVVRWLLRDLGPKTAAEIKDEMCELVIPEDEWSKWWPTARAKIKKDTLIEAPEDLREPFVLRSAEVSHDDRLRALLAEAEDIPATIHLIYSFSRDYPEILKKPETKEFLCSKARESLAMPNLTEAQTLALTFFVEDFSGDKTADKTALLIQNSPSIESLALAIHILSFKKRLLTQVRALRPDWKEIFLKLLLTIDQNSIRDYLFTELNHPLAQVDLKRRLQEALETPTKYPHALVWYFQKVTSQEGIPFADQKGRTQFFEAFFVVLHYIEQQVTEKDLVKKMHTVLTANKYLVVRELMKGASLETTKELLLLATKCHSLADHDIKILHALAEVVHPSLGKMRKRQETEQESFIWTTEAGFRKLKERMQEIATVETVANAKEIEVARAHGDLRENAEFKAALEKRDRLQADLRALSEQANKARVLTADDVSTEAVGVGCVVSCKNKAGKQIQYTLLGPWDADIDKGIISFQSKLAQEMEGRSVGDTFRFQGDEFTIETIRSFFD